MPVSWTYENDLYLGYEYAPGTQENCYGFFCNGTPADECDYFVKLDNDFGIANDDWQYQMRAHTVHHRGRIPVVNLLAIGGIKQ